MDYWQPFVDNVTYGGSVSQLRRHRNAIRSHQARSRGLFDFPNTGNQARYDEASYGPMYLSLAAVVGCCRNEMDEEVPRTVGEHKGCPLNGCGETGSLQSRTVQPRIEYEFEEKEEERRIYRHEKAKDEMNYCTPQLDGPLPRFSCAELVRNVGRDVSVVGEWLFGAGLALPAEDRPGADMDKMHRSQCLTPDTRQRVSLHDEALYDKRGNKSNLLDAKSFELMT